MGGVRSLLREISGTSSLCFSDPDRSECHDPPVCSKICTHLHKNRAIFLTISVTYTRQTIHQ